MDDAEKLKRLDLAASLIEGACDNHNAAHAYLVTNNTDCVPMFMAAIADSILALGMLSQVENDDRREARRVSEERIKPLLEKLERVSSMDAGRPGDPQKDRPPVVEP